MMNSSQGLLLFSFFAGAVVFDKYIKRIKADSMPSIDACYASTIKKLFKFTFKLPSRHSTSPQFSSIELFQLRKAFYLKNSFNSEILKRAKIIHVAGTKGKGSTAEYISAGLRYSKEFKVGVFTSPHLHTARERIKIGSSLISKEDFIRLGEESIIMMETVSWATFFDMLVHLAMKYFTEQKVDYIVMEAGIGGRFDTTNFIDSSEVSVITSISLDHQALLGETVEEIAFQKAGIIKKNGNVFTSAAQDAGVLRVLREECVKMNATLHIIPVIREEVVALGLHTSYSVQIQNACLAMAVLRFLKVPTEGLKTFFWPCRMERFVLDGVTLILDGCHNDDSVRQFMLGLREKYPDSSLVVLFGAGMEKYLPDMLGHVFEKADSTVMVQSRHFKSLSEIDLVAAVDERFRPLLQSSGSGSQAPSPYNRQDSGTIAERLLWNIEHAKREKARLGKDVVVAVCGSLFAASEAREVIFRESPGLFSSEDWVRHTD